MLFQVSFSPTRMIGSESIYYIQYYSYQNKKKIYTNSNKKSLLLRYTFFGLPIINDTVFDDIQYVGVHVENDYESKDFTIKIWFANNKYQDIAYRFNANSALDLGEILSEALKVKMLDNTIKGQKNWIENK